MIPYLITRFFQSVTVLLAMSFLIYGLIALMPGDPVDLMVAGDPNITAADAARLRELYGTDKPILVRYKNWLFTALNGDFGFSRLYARPVLPLIGEALQNTVILLGSSFVIALIFALPLGVLAAVRPQSKLDHSINMLAFAGISLPPFWLSLMLIIVFAVGLTWLPAGGTEPRQVPVGFLKGSAIWSSLLPA